MGGITSAKSSWIPETRFGVWFQSTDIWHEYVLTESLKTLADMEQAQPGQYARILDVGCGAGMSFPIMDELFAPREILGIDIDPELVAEARLRTEEYRCSVEVRCESVTELALPDASIDLVLCHQLLHHLCDQQGALAEFRRVLRPGGRLLVTESCNEFINRYWIRLLFRHPDTQHTAAGYENLVRNAGFVIHPEQVMASSPWWSLPFFGALEKYGLGKPAKEPTQVFILATKEEHLGSE